MVRALRVVPGPVKVRVAAIVLTALAALGLLLWALRSYPILQGAAALFIALFGGYVGWCRWPRWRWGIARAQLHELPQPPGQPLRLSFDDGPTPEVTPLVLDLLAQAGVRASFFVLTQKARLHPELIRRIVAEGHILGLHGEDHRLPFGRPAEELAASLARARAELAQLAGQPIELYRPSHGFKNPALLKAVRAAGLRLCFWDYGVWDTDAPPVAVLVQRLRAVTPAAGEPAPGPIVLLHDGLGDLLQCPHAPAMTAALRQWLPTLRPSSSPASARPGA
jgi:peptidoglycan/xylan/chitin deacetylase (PgdA/CDA1 family)